MHNRDMVSKRVQFIVHQIKHLKGSNFDFRRLTIKILRHSLKNANDAIFVTNAQYEVGNYVNYNEFE